MEHATIIGIDLAKRSFQLHGTRADGSVAFRRKLSRDTMLRFVAAQPRLRCRDGGPARVRTTGAVRSASSVIREAGPTDLREAVREAAEERRGGRGGDLRGGLAADDALRSGEDARAAGSGHAVPHARPAGSSAHPDDQRPTGTFGRVRRCRSAGTGLVGRLAEAIEDADSGLPDPVRELGALLLDQVADLDEEIAGLEHELRERTREDERRCG